MKQRILITGSNGYIGSVLVPDLVKDGYLVSGIDSNLYENGLLNVGEYSSLTFQKDIRDITPEDVRDFDTIIHLAGLSNDPLGELNKELTYEINQYAATRLAKIARENGVKRFIFASSCSVYGDGGELFLEESSKVNPQTAYAHSKLLAEQEIALLATESFSPIFVRAGTVYGFSPNMRFDLVVNIFVRNVILAL